MLALKENEQSADRNARTQKHQRSRWNVWAATGLTRCHGADPSVGRARRGSRSSLRTSSGVNRDWKVHVLVPNVGGRSCSNSTAFVMQVRKQGFDEDVIRQHLKDALKKKSIMSKEVASYSRRVKIRLCARPHLVSQCALHHHQNATVHSKWMKRLLFRTSPRTNKCKRLQSVEPEHCVERKRTSKTQHMRTE